MIGLKTVAQTQANDCICNNTLRQINTDVANSSAELQVHN